MIGSTIGSYRITGLLGEGGMGAVYRATDNIEREVAIKALHPQLTRDEGRLQRFRSEAIALGRLHHPNIASLYHLLEQDGNFYMVMEFVEGQTLEDIVRQHGALPPRQALDIFNDGLHGFEHAHARGVIHRDIKPSNLMVSTEGRTKITDFGIARMAGSGRLTQTGKLIGTLEYMSPEQVRGLEQDARSDIYSLGILLFELLTGRMPFTATSDFDIMRAHLEEAPPPARNFVATLPPALDEILAKALAKEPAARFESVAQLRTALETVARELPSAAPATTLVSIPVQQPAPATTVANVPAGTPIQSPPFAPPTRIDTPVSPRPTANKWMIPAAMGGVLVLVVGALALNSFRPSSTIEATPTPTSVSRQVTSDPTPTSEESQGNSSQNINSDVLPVVEPTPVAQIPDIEIPETIPGFNSDPTPKKTQPRKAVPTTPSTPIRRREQTTTVTKQPSQRVVKRRVATVRTRRREAVRNVERAKPRRRVVREEVRRRPTKVAQRPQRRRSSGGGEQAALRALIKGN